MRHRYECPLRWADMDLLGHVNNVMFVDYLQEARVDMLALHAVSPDAEALVTGAVVARNEVTYLAPLVFDHRSVSIETWVTEIRAASFTLGYEVFHDRDDGERTVYLRAATLLTPYDFETKRPRRLSPAERSALERHLEPAEPVRLARPRELARTDIGHYPLRVRFSDVDVYSHVNNVKYYEYFQEARIAMIHRLMQELPDGGPANLVVARVDVDYRVPMVFRPAPYDVWTEITHVGRTSFVVEGEIRDDEQQLAQARVVLVFFDPATQRAAAPTEAQRELLVAQLQR